MNVRSKVGRRVGGGVLVVALSVTAAIAWRSRASMPDATPVVVAEVPSPPTFREVRWDDLMPEGWDPYRRLTGKETDRIDDADAKAGALMDEMRAAWDAAPTVSALDGAAVRIPGYLVPLDEEHGRLREFLLVPYFGACIHTPPPPANQIVHVRLKRPAEGFKAMDTVWVDGSLRLAREDSFMGTSGYDLVADRIERYVVPRR